MSDKIDRILAAIDTGMQHSDEPSYSFDDFDHHGPRRCTRTACRAELDDDPGDLCPPCRAYLLGDTDTDPATGAPDLAPFEITPARGSITAFTLTVAEILRPIADLVLIFPDDVRDLILGRREITDDEVDRLEQALLDHQADPTNERNTP